MVDYKSIIYSCTINLFLLTRKEISLISWYVCVEFIFIIFIVRIRYILSRGEKTFILVYKVIYGILIVYSDHALEQKKRRRIPTIQIYKTIIRSDSTEKSYRGRVVRRRRFGKKVLEVISKTEGNRNIIITAYYLGG